MVLPQDVFSARSGAPEPEVVPHQWKKNPPISNCLRNPSTLLASTASYGFHCVSDTVQSALFGICQWYFHSILVNSCVIRD